LFRVDILSSFINSQPEKVPKTPYLSVLIALATSFAVTKPIVVLLFVEQKTKIVKQMKL